MVCLYFLSKYCGHRGYSLCVLTIYSPVFQYESQLQNFPPTNRSTDQIIIIQTFSYYLFPTSNQTIFLFFFNRLSQGVAFLLSNGSVNNLAVMKSLAPSSSVVTRKATLQGMQSHNLFMRRHHTTKEQKEIWS